MTKKLIPSELVEASYVETRYAHHATELAKEALDNGADQIVAVGGDGTVNEVAMVLIGTGVSLGIVPVGSGNGLARYLKIPIDSASAVKKILKNNELSIDSGCVNGQAFFNVAGIGFDALISDRFADRSERGPVGYMRVVLEEISRYKAEPYEIVVDGKSYSEKAFMISIANSPQYGNNAYVAPEASVRDGLLDVSIIKEFPLYQFPVMVYHLFSRTAHQSEFVEIIKGKNIRIRRQRPGPVHLDGEPVEMGEELDVEIRPSSLKVLH